MRSYKALLNPVADFLLIGGLSIIVIPIFLVLRLHEPQTLTNLAMLFFVLGYVANYPHFAATYQLFYGEQHGRILKSWPWIAVGVVIPLLMAIYISVNYAIVKIDNIGYLATFLLLVVGWHYVKQVFGCMIVTGCRAEYFFDKIQRVSLKTNLFALWCLTLTSNFRKTPFFVFDSIPYPFLLLPEAFEIVPYATMVISTGVFLIATNRKHKASGQWPPLMMWVPWVAVYMWFLPIVHDIAVYYMVPFFHSIQYLLFVAAYKKNQFNGEASPVFVRKMIMFFGVAAVLGGLFMEVIPRALDLTVSLSWTELTIFLAIFHLFVNIHHYFLDFVLWRKDVPEFQNYVLFPQSSRGESGHNSALDDYPESRKII